MEFTEKQQSIVRDILVKNGVNLAYIFGSHSRGTAGSLSDLDIAIVFNDAVSRADYFDTELTVVREISEAIRKEVDVINIATLEQPVLRHRAVFMGECIIDADPQRRFILERAILREYEDTAMLRRLQREIRHRFIKQGTFGSPARSIHGKHRKA